MIVRGFSPSDVEAIITPLGFIVRRRGDHQQGTFRVQLKRHQWAYLFTPATDRYRLFSKQGKPTEQSCIHGLIAIIQALRAARPKVQIHPETGEVACYHALSALSAKVEIGALQVGPQACTCSEDR